MSLENSQNDVGATAQATHSSNRDADIVALEHAPTGAPMEARHWVFLCMSGIVLPILILLWGWV